MTDKASEAGLDFERATFRENARPDHAALSRAKPVVSKSSVRDLALEPHVLFVDDDVSNLVVWEAICDGELAALTAQDADAALTIMAREEVGVLVTDQRMPGTTGIELLERVRTQYPDTIRVLVTAYSDLSAAIDAINRGHVRRFLRKPVEPATLKAELRDALEVYVTNRKLRALEWRLFETERVYALGVVAAGFGSELKTPLSWLSHNLQLARDTLNILKAKEDTARLRSWLMQLEEVLADVEQGVSRIADVVRSIELPTVEHEEELIDMSEVIRLTLRLVIAELHRATSLELDVRPVPRVRGSSTLLGQVVLNLVVNAMQALKQRARSENVITVRLVQRGAEVVLEVVDNGERMSHGDMQGIFDRFRIPRDTRGAGLGLAISKTIAEQHGGRLEVANSWEGGALFRFVLPAAR